MDVVLWLVGLTSNGEPVPEAQAAADEIVRLRKAGDLLERVVSDYCDGTGGTMDELGLVVDGWREVRW